MSQNLAAITEMVEVHKERETNRLLFASCNDYQESAYSHMFGWFVRWEVSGHTAAVLWGVASKICIKQHVAF